jgi:GNAT superfamily N-acetyltransferase
MPVRRATLDDLEALIPLFEGYRGFYGESPDPDMARTFLGERLALGESVILLAEVDGRPVGFTQLYPIFSSTRCRRLWLLNDLFVAPEGRRAGTGQALLEAARRFAQESGAAGLELMTARTNLAAQRLYERLGWQRDEVFLHYELPLA